MKDLETCTDHVEVIATQETGGIALNRVKFIQAQQDSLAEASSPWQTIKNNGYTCLVILIVQVNAVVLGLEYVFLGALVGVQAFCRTMGSLDETTGTYAVAASTLSLWAGVFGLMQLLGQLFAGWFADRFGRRRCIFLMVFNIYIGVMTEVLSRNRYDYTGAKILMGSATGMMQVLIPTYVAEVAPRDIRGITIGVFGFNLSLGSFIATFVTYSSNQAWGANSLDNRGWKVPLYVGLAAPTITLVPMIFMMPESPYWLILRNRVNEAKQSLRRLRPATDDVDRIAEEMQYTVFKECQERDAVKDASYMECLRRSNLRRTFSAVFPSLSQQLVGNQLVQSYSTYFFELAGLSNALLGSVIVSCVGLMSAVVAFFLIELKSVGRWPLVFFGVLGITLSMLGIGIVDSADHGHTNSSAGAALVAFVALFNAAVTMGPGVTGWSYAAESASARLRAKTTTLAVGCNAVIGTVTNIVIPLELAAIGPKTGYMFFGIGVISCVLVYVWIPELSGRSYGQLDELFERGIPARQFKKTACTGEYGLRPRDPKTEEL